MLTALSFHSVRGCAVSSQQHDIGGSSYLSRKRSRVGLRGLSTGPKSSIWGSGSGLREQHLGLRLRVERAASGFRLCIEREIAGAQAMGPEKQLWLRLWVQRNSWSSGYGSRETVGIQTMGPKKQLGLRLWVQRNSWVSGYGFRE